MVVEVMVVEASLQDMADRLQEGVDNAGVLRQAGLHTVILH